MLITKTSDIKKIYVYRANGGVCAEVALLTNGNAIFADAIGRREVLTPDAAFSAARARRGAEA